MVFFKRAADQSGDQKNHEGKIHHITEIIILNIARKYKGNRQKLKICSGRRGGGKDEFKGDGPVDGGKVLRKVCGIVH